MISGAVLNQFSQATGIPLSIYRDGALFYEQGIFHPNPAYEIMKALTIPGEGVYYTISPDYLFCGFIQTPDEIYVAGPVSSYECTRGLVQRMLKMLGASANRELEMMRWFREMPTCNSLRFQQAMYFLSRLISGENYTVLTHLAYQTPVRRNPAEDIDVPFMNRMDDELEKTILMLVESGNVAGMEKILYQGDSAGFGQLAEDSIRSFKNTFIMSASILSRAAINGGLDYQTAISVFDEYIREIEQMTAYPEILSLIRQMFLDFTRRTARARRLPSDSAIVSRVCAYVQAHLNEKITTGEIAAHLGINRSYLCRHFKEKTDMTISDYVNNVKIEESKRMLKYTFLPLSLISFRLGFTSQNYFHTVFKKMAGMTPLEYRNE